MDDPTSDSRVARQTREGEPETDVESDEAESSELRIGYLMGLRFAVEQMHKHGVHLLFQPSSLLAYNDVRCEIARLS